MSERFDEYMERCLYHPTDGFYASARGIAGRRGDFITSPEVGPLFGAVLARALDAWWDELGQPSPFPVIDLGTGPGTLLRALQAASPRCARSWQLIGVDRANEVELPSDLSNAVIIANELLDNVSFRIARRTVDGWEEVFVGASGDEWRPLIGDQPAFGDAPAPPVGVSFPLLTNAAALLDDLLARGPARVVAFDYGAATTAELAERGGWLRTYREHQRGSDPHVEPGEWDITTDIAVDQLPGPCSVETQATFLRRHGIDDLVAEGKAHWAEHAAKPDLAAMRMRSRVSEADALLDSAGLGGWLCLEWVG